MTSPPSQEGRGSVNTKSLILALACGALAFAAVLAAVNLRSLQSSKTPAPTEPSATETLSATQPSSYNDAFAYCAAVGTVDAPDSRYTGDKVPQVIADGLEKQGFPDNGVSWRCAGGRVLACGVGANLPCYPADTRRDPNQGMIEQCRATPDANFIPAYITGHATIYQWACKEGQPYIARQQFHADERGFVQEMWHEVRP